ncbi:hypothetical protein KJ359_003039 [Pestalotiopsis sp. 9143b]|nr:hypothetical protein KJ359_003039 [Pestalotiopsis sp. 9143b]
MSMSSLRTVKSFLGWDTIVEDVVSPNPRGPATSQDTTAPAATEPTSDGSNPAQGTVSSRPERILATSYEPGYENIIRLLTSDKRVLYVLVTKDSLSPDGDWRKSYWDVPLLGDLPQVLPPGGKCVWLEPAFSSTGARTLAARQTGLPLVCDGLAGFDSDDGYVLKIDYAELTPAESPVTRHTERTARHVSEKVSTVTHPGFPGRMLVMRIVPFPECLWMHPATRPEGVEEWLEEDPGGPRVLPREEMPLWAEATPSRLMEREIAIYRAAAEAGLAPKFIGLVTEEGRGVIGYLSEYISGPQTLADVLNAAVVTKKEAMRVTQECVDLAKSLHELGYVHGDLHPGNVLRGPDDRWFLIDFEFARKIEDASGNDPKVSDLSALTHRRFEYSDADPESDSNADSDSDSDSDSDANSDISID